MLINFKIEQKDFLIFQLYTISKSANVLKTRRRGQLITTFAGFVLAINLFVTGSAIAGLLMIFISILTYVYYPKYHRWRLKSHFTKYSKKNYGEHFGKDEILEIKSDHIISKNIAGEGKVMQSELQKLIEIPDYYFLSMKSGTSIILPKRDIKFDKEMVKEFKNIGVSLEQELTWVY